MYRDASIITSLSDDWPSRPLVEMWLLVRSVFTVETIAFWTVVHCWQSQAFLPIVHKEKDISSALHVVVQTLLCTVSFLDHVETYSATSEMWPSFLVPQVPLSVAAPYPWLHRLLFEL